MYYRPSPTPTFAHPAVIHRPECIRRERETDPEWLRIKDKLGDPIPSYAIGKKYLILNITYENLQLNKTADVDLKGMTVQDTGGFAFEQITDDAMLDNPFYLNGKKVPPLENRTGNMAFIINPDATFLKFEYNFGDQKNAVFQLPQYL